MKKTKTYAEQMAEFKTTENGEEIVLQYAFKILLS